MTSIRVIALRQRRAPRAVAILISALVVAASTFVFSALSTARSQSGASADPGAVPAAVALPGDAAAISAIGSITQIDHSIAAWTANLADNPKDFIAAANLATLYHARGRLTGNLDDQTRALDAARTAERIAPSQTGGSSLEAAILYTLHDFTGSLAIVNRLVRANPADLSSLATRADDELELGQTAAAGIDYATVAAGASGPAVDVRLARLAYLTGDPARALDLARSALAAAATGQDTDLGFYHYAVGEYARLLGRSDLAGPAYGTAVALRPTDFASILGLAKVEAAGGNITLAISELKRAADIVPQPETLALLGDLRSMSGDARGAAEAHATIRAIRQLSAIEGSVFDRQLALFELDHGGATPAILDSAEAGLATRTDAAGYDLAAWAAYRLGRFDLAQRYVDRALAGGIRDARILGHAGAIALAAGNRTAGTELLRAALALGPALDPLATTEAKRLLGL